MGETFKDTFSRYGRAQRGVHGAVTPSSMVLKTFIITVWLAVIIYRLFLSEYVTKIDAKIRLP